MFGELISMRVDIEALKTAFGNSLKVGPVHEVDAAKGYRVKWGESADGADYLSPWYPHPESGGQNSTWVPLSVGQVVGTIQPNADPRQALLIRGGFSGINPPISDDVNEVALDFPGVRVSIKGGVVTISSDGPVTVNAPKVHLGGEGGPKVARVGDMVNVGAGSSAGMWPIVTGSNVVSAI